MMRDFGLFLGEREVQWLRGEEGVQPLLEEVEGQLKQEVQQLQEVEALQQQEEEVQQLLEEVEVRRSQEVLEAEEED